MGISQGSASVLKMGGWGISNIRYMRSLQDRKREKIHLNGIIQNR